MKTINMSEDEFFDQFKPIQNTLVPDASYNGCMFETYGPEYDFVQQQKPANIWTVIDTELYPEIISGFNIVNRIGYLITEKPWEDNVCYEIEDTH